MLFKEQRKKQRGFIMKKTLYIIAATMLVLTIIAVSASCTEFPKPYENNQPNDANNNGNNNSDNNDGDNGNNNDDNGDNNGDNSDNNGGAKDILSIAAKADDANIVIEGTIRDVFFEKCEGVEVLLTVLEDGKTKEKSAAVSDEGGNFTLYIKTESLSDMLRVYERIGLNGTIYNYNIVHQDHRTNSSVYGNINIEADIEIVCALKDSGINVNNLLTYGNKVTFHANGLQLPDDYPNIREDLTLTYGGVTINGETRLVGVEFYIGDNLIAVGNEYGFDLKNIYPGTIITVKKEGFYFVRLMADNQIGDLTVTVNDVLYEDSFIAPPYNNPFPYNIRAVLKDGVSMDDLNW